MSYRSYQRHDVQTASRPRLLVLLMQEAGQRIRQAKGLTAGTPPYIEHLHRARAIYMELLTAIDAASAPELARQLVPLYRWCISELIAAGQEPERLAAVEGVTDTLTSAWFDAVRAS